MGILNMLGIAAALIVNVVIGAFWYSPKFLGSIWASSYQFDRSELKPAPVKYAASVLVNFILVFCLFFLRKMADITSIVEGIEFGVLLWVTLIATTHFSAVIWAKKPLMAYLVDVFYILVVLIVSNVILGVL